VRVTRIATRGAPPTCRSSGAAERARISSGPDHAQHPCLQGETPRHTARLPTFMPEDPDISEVLIVTTPLHGWACTKGSSSLVIELRRRSAWVHDGASAAFGERHAVALHVQLGTHTHTHTHTMPSSFVVIDHHIDRTHSEHVEIALCVLASPRAVPLGPMAHFAGTSGRCRSWCRSWPHGLDLNRMTK